MMTGGRRNIPNVQPEGFEMLLREVISPETKSRDLLPPRNSISNPEVRTFGMFPTTKVIICYIVWVSQSSENNDIGLPSTCHENSVVCTVE